MFFVLSYVSLKEIVKRKSSAPDHGWKTVGVAAAWLITSFAFAQMMYLLNSPYILPYDRPTLVALLIFGERNFLLIFIKILLDYEHLLHLI